MLSLNITIFYLNRVFPKAMCLFSTSFSRGVAQPGSAPVLGTGGRKFESCRPDQFSKTQSSIGRGGVCPRNTSEAIAGRFFLLSTAVEAGFLNKILTKK